MWEYNTYRPAVTVTTNRAEGGVTSTSSRYQLQASSHGGTDDPYTVTNTYVFFSRHATNYSATVEYVAHDLFAGTNSNGGSSYYPSYKSSQTYYESESVTGSNAGKDDSHVIITGYSQTYGYQDFDVTVSQITSSACATNFRATSTRSVFAYSTAYLGGMSTSTLTITSDGSGAESGTWWTISMRSFTDAGGVIRRSGSTTSGVSYNFNSGLVVVSGPVGTVYTTSWGTTQRLAQTLTNSYTGSTTNGGTVLLVTSKTYNITTITTAQTQNRYTTTASTRSSIYPSSSSSLNGTITVYFSTSTSSVDNYINTTLVTSAVTNTTYNQGTTQRGAIQDTVFEPATTDWGWFVTNPGTGLVGDVGASFNATVTASLYYAGGNRSVVSASRHDSVSPFVTLTYYSTSFVQGTTASSRTTTSQSTYLMAGPTSVADTVPFSITTQTLTVSYVSTRATTYTYTSGTVLTAYTIQDITNTTASYTYQASVTRTNITTTFTGGTSYGTYSQTIPSQWDILIADNHTSSSSSSTSSTTYLSNTWRTSASITTSWSSTAVSTWATASIYYKAHLTSTSPLPTFTDITVQAGFQILGQLGPGNDFGTNINLAVALPMRSACASAFRDGPVTPVWLKETQKFPTITTYESNGVAITANTTTTTTDAPGTTYVTGIVYPGVAALSYMTLSNSFSGTQFGGRGWDHTKTGTTISGSTGLHRATVYNTGGFTTTQISWSAHPEYSILAGNGFVGEALPQARSTTGAPHNSNAILTFLAYPLS